MIGVSLQFVGIERSANSNLNSIIKYSFCFNCQFDRQWGSLESGFQCHFNYYFGILFLSCLLRNYFLGTLSTSLICLQFIRSAAPACMMSPASLGTCQQMEQIANLPYNCVCSTKGLDFITSFVSGGNYWTPCDCIGPCAASQYGACQSVELSWIEASQQWQCNLYVSPSLKGTTTDCPKRRL